MAKASATKTKTAATETPAKPASPLDAVRASLLAGTAPENLRVEGDLDLSFSDGLTSLPRGLDVLGSLVLSGCTELKALPEGLRVRDALHIDQCIALTELPAGLRVAGYLQLSGCKRLVSLPNDLRADGSINAAGTALRELPDGLVVGKNLLVEDCPKLTSLGEGLRVAGDLWVGKAVKALPEGLFVGGELRLTEARIKSLPKQWTARSVTVPKKVDLQKLFGSLDVPCGLDIGEGEHESLPEGMHVHGHLTLSSVETLTGLPPRLTVDGDVTISGCNGLTEIPADATFGAKLSIQDNDSIGRLPDGLHVAGDLDLYFCHGLQELPAGLRVEKNLTLNNCSQITSLPDDLFVGGDLEIVPFDPPVASLPPGLHVRGNVFVPSSERLKKVGPRTRIEGSLLAYGCPNLGKLPDDLVVGGDVDLRTEAKAKARPKPAGVAGSLMLKEVEAQPGAPRSEAASLSPFEMLSHVERELTKLLERAKDLAYVASCADTETNERLARVRAAYPNEVPEGERDSFFRGLWPAVLVHLEGAREAAKRGGAAYLRHVREGFEKARAVLTWWRNRVEPSGPEWEALSKAERKEHKTREEAARAADPEACEALVAEAALGPSGKPLERSGPVTAKLAVCCLLRGITDPAAYNPIDALRTFPELRV